MHDFRIKICYRNHKGGTCIRNSKRGINLKAAAVFLSACTCLSGLFGCAASATAQTASADKSWQKVQNAKTLVVGVDSSFAPMSFTDGKGQLTGFDIDTATEVCHRLNITVKFESIDWSQKNAELNNGKIDCIWSGYTKTQAGSSQSNLSLSYMPSSQVVICLSGQPVKNIAALKQQRIGVKDGSAGQDAVESSTAFKSSLESVTVYKDYEVAVTALNNKKVTAVILDDVTAKYYLKQKKNTYVILYKDDGKTEDTLSTGYYAVAFRANDQTLTNQVQSVLAQMEKDGTMSSISKKWFNEDLTGIDKQK